MYIHIYLYVYVHIYVYIYMYIFLMNMLYGALLLCHPPPSPPAVAQNILPSLSHSMCCSLSVVG